MLYSAALDPQKTQLRLFVLVQKDKLCTVEAGCEDCPTCQASPDVFSATHPESLHRLDKCGKIPRHPFLGAGADPSVERARQRVMV